jgi:hypothetical protein
MYKVDQEKWNQFPANMQLKNIAAEIARVKSAGLRGDKEKENNAYLRAISLIDASIADTKQQDRKFLYELRDTVSASYAGNVNPAISNFIYNQILAKSDF